MHTRYPLSIHFDSKRLKITKFKLRKSVPIAQMVERPLRKREVVGLIPGCAIPKALK